VSVSLLGESSHYTNRTLYARPYVLCVSCTLVYYCSYMLGLMVSPLG